jgi:cell division protein FtsQ
MKKYFNWTNVRLLFVLTLVIFLFSFGKIRNSNRNLQESKVEFVGNEPLFVTHESVNKLLIENKTDASAIRKDALDLRSLEEVLNQHEMVEKAEVFVSIEGVLNAIVKQKTPIARFAHNDKTYYIDSQGNKMPLSESYSARVPLITGEESKIASKQVHDIMMLIHEDEFLRVNIIGIKVLSNGALELKNRGFEFQVVFGGAVNGKEKFNNYKAFLQKAVGDSSVYQYRKIDLRFNNQVVCTK